jgi:hypothetical protein
MLQTAKVYLESAFTQVIMDLQIAIQELQSKVLYGDNKVQEKILKKQERINELIEQKAKPFGKFRTNDTT